MVSLSLAAFTAEDLDWLLDIEAEARAEGFIRGNDRSAHEAHMARTDSLYLKICADNAPAGYVILGGMGGQDNVIELGRIVIDTAYRGIGQAALRILIDYIFKTFDAHKIWLDTLHHNHRGQHIYSKLGFACEGRLREAFLMNGVRYDMILYGLLRSDWQKSRNL